MKLHNSIALAAVAAVLAVPTMAEAKVKHHHVKAKKVAAAKAEAGLTTTEQLQLAQQQLAQMQAQLNDLQAKVSAPAPKDTATADAAKAASTKADKALATAEKAQAAVTKTDKAVAAVKWAADTTVGGNAFFNVSNVTQHTAGGNNASTGTGVNVKRVYITIDHKFSNVLSANITTDASNVVGNSSFYANTAGANTTATTAQTVIGKGFYVKNLYLQAKLDPALVVRVGAADMPWIPYVQSVYGRRFVENVMTDRLSYANSADWGVHVSGDLANGLISYALSAVDGAGYRKVYVTKSVDLEGRVSTQYKGLYAAVGGYTGKLGNNAEVVGTTTPSTFRTAKRFDAIGGYKNQMFGLGVEYFYAKNWNNVTINPANYALSEDSAEGISAFANVNLSKKWTVFTRYDAVKPNHITVPNLRDDYFNVGLQYSPAKMVDIALVYKRETVNGGAVKSTDGTIGCATSATANAFASAANAAATCAGNGTYDEIGIWGQFKF